MKLFYNEKRHILIEPKLKGPRKKVAPLTVFECDASLAASLMERYNRGVHAKGVKKKIMEVGSPEYKERTTEIQKSGVKQSFAPGTRPEEIARDLAKRGIGTSPVVEPTVAKKQGTAA